MSTQRATFIHDHDAIVQKFVRLLGTAEGLVSQWNGNDENFINPIHYFEVRTSGLNLLARTAGENSIYYQELRGMQKVNPGIMMGILTAAQTDFREGFMADAKLLVSAEILQTF